MPGGVGGQVGREAGLHVEVEFDLDFGSDVIMWSY